MVIFDKQIKKGLEHNYICHMNTHDYYEPLLRKELKPLYIDLLDAVKPYRVINDDLRPFAMQWGEEFPKGKHRGILFVGKATNGYITPSDNIDVLFGSSDEAIFDRPNQMKWVELNNELSYNTNRSAFWRVIRKVASAYYPTHELNHVAWSDVVKVAPDGGNPNNKLYYLQLECCQKILATEINILSPKAVVFLTGDSWAKDFITYLGNGSFPQIIAEQEWEGGYSTKLYRFNKLGIIMSEHPQGKDEYTHVEAIKQLIDLI